MSSKRVSPISQAWFKWKALRLPWRRRFLVGFDLEGNTYWEFRLTRGTEESSERWRRIVDYPRSAHYSQVKVSPQWHQWLRYTRRDPPSLEEQQSDVIRQAKMKHLAAAADARWEAKPRVMEAPRTETTTQALPPLDAGVVKEEAAAVANADEPKTQPLKKAHANDPWIKAKPQGPSEKWQPTTWNPTPSTKR
ncbi:NADH-ubiquinone oxidoreductase assembly factor N7BML [Cladobotryum mycophilum]|uniref:NADH-ubiquinone oxidoreductase assembly factor N7BML n=1 Tax=Cladobotryum mycophilum TaxID=491253 RepID=A0ABR0SDE8_9HYPO